MKTTDASQLSFALPVLSLKQQKISIFSQSLRKIEYLNLSRYFKGSFGHKNTDRRSVSFWQNVEVASRRNCLPLN